jgi:RNA polymerase sigma factor (sigma-70 family)
VKTYKAIHHDLRDLFEAGALGRLSDGELLERFVSSRDEPAFEAIVRRHGAMVLGVCRRVLGDHHDAEDAFQATFLVLSRKARSVRPGAMLPNWLYGVAHQVAIKARANNARRRSRERQVTTMPEPETESIAALGDDLSGLIDQELSRLPAKYRAPVVLCELEGLGHREAADKLGWPVGTVSGRLSRARAMLAKRLTRQGLAFSAGSLAVAIGREASAASLPAALVQRTIEAAIPFAAGQAIATGGVSLLARRVLGAMMMTKLIAMTGAGLAGGMLLFGGLVGQRILAGQAVRGPSRPAGRPPAVAEDASAKDAKLLQGTWQGVESEYGGKKASAYESRNQLMTFSGDEFVGSAVHNTGPVRPSRYKLDANQTPKAIDITWVEGRERGETWASIYALEKGRLMICYPKDPSRRPTAFKSNDDGGAAVVVLERVGPKGPVDPGPRDATLAGFEPIQRDYDRQKWVFWNAFMKAVTPEERRKATVEKQPKPDQFAERFWKLAQDRPNTREELFALCWAVMNAPTTEAGKKALAVLENGRLAGADVGDLAEAIRTARTDQESLPSPLAGLVLQRAEANLDHPAAARLLMWVCNNYWNGDLPEEPRTFAEAANLIAARFPDSPDIFNFGECLVNRHEKARPWAIKYERHLRTILDRNHTRWVRCTALYALAAIADSAGAARQDEAAALFESLIKQFEDLSDPSTKNVEEMVLNQARRQLKEIRDRKANRPAPKPGAAR